MNETSEQDHVDPVIVDAVENISNRFGTQGLNDLIELARERLTQARAALEGLSDLDAGEGNGQQAT